MEKYKLLDKIEGVVSNQEISVILSEKKIVDELTDEIDELKKDFEDIKNTMSSRSQSFKTREDLIRFVESKFNKNKHILQVLDKFAKNNFDNINRLIKTIKGDTSSIIKELDRYENEVKIEQNSLLKIRQLKQLLINDANELCNSLNKEIESIGYIKVQLIPEIGSAVNDFIKVQNDSDYAVINKLEKVKLWILSVQEQAHSLFKKYDYAVKVLEELVKFSESHKVA